MAYFYLIFFITILFLLEIMRFVACISGFCLLCYLLNNWTDYPTKFVQQLVYATAIFQYPNDLGCRSKVSSSLPICLQYYHLANGLFVLFCFTSQVNSYGHGGMVSSPYHTFSWASFNKQLTSTSCTYFRL